MYCKIRLIKTVTIRGMNLYDKMKYLNTIQNYEVNFNLVMCKINSILLYRVSSQTSFKLDYPSFFHE